MVKPDLSRASDLDFAALDLDFDAFRALARNPNLDPHGKIGFPTAYREGREPAIFADILGKLPRIAGSENRVVVDIGPGCANLPRMLIELCVQRGHRLILIDSDEMLAQLPDVEGVTFKVPGAFPSNRQDIWALTPGGADAMICYSVLHYMVMTTDVSDVVDAAVSLLAPGGRALFGDIPNVSKRRRLFASETGKAFHRAYTGRDEDPPIDLGEPSPGKIDDAVLLTMMRRAQAAGCDSYLVPQADVLPMANRRDDLMIARP